MQFPVIYRTGLHDTVIYCTINLKINWATTV